MKAHPFEYLKSRADVLKCCGNVDNLGVTSPQADVLLATCAKCGRRHRKMKVDPGSVLGKSLAASVHG